MRTGFIFPGLTFLVTLTVGLLFTAIVYRQERLVRGEMVSETLEDLAHRTSERIHQFDALLTATAAYIATRPRDLVERGRFSSYVSALGDLTALAGLQGVGLAPLVPRAEEAQLNARLRANHGPEAKVWPEATEAPLRSAIMLLAPEDPRNLSAIGYDMYSEPLRRDAMDRARATRRPSLSAPVTLVQEDAGDPQMGALIYVYMDGSLGAEGEGFVYSPIRMRHLFDVLAISVRSGTLLRIEDEEVPDPPLYLSPGVAGRDLSPLAANALTVEIGGRRWRMTSYSPPPMGGYLGPTPVAVLIGFAALLLAGSMAAAVHGLSGRMLRGRALDEAQSRRLAEKDLHLREMSHRLKNVLARVVAMARQAARHADTKEEFIGALNQRLQAMATAQDLLTRSAVDGADLQELIAAEIAQIYGSAQEVAVMSGPQVTLTAQQTQALGLCMHELATNALKYGAGAIEGSELRITWRIEGNARGGMVGLCWEELTGCPTTPPEHKGFGSRLLESCITLELGGAIRREHHASGLRVEIDFPLRGLPS